MLPHIVIPQRPESVVIIANQPKKFNSILPDPFLLCPGRKKPRTVDRQKTVNCVHVLEKTHFNKHTRALNCLGYITNHSRKDPIKTFVR